MTRRATAKKRISRALRVNLWGDPKSTFNAKPYRPGQHGKRVVKLSDYGRQLHAKQALKNYYGEITEKQFYKTFVEAARRKGDTSENLIQLLERRLAAVIYRAKFAPTVHAARQLVSHGHVKINGKRTNIASASVEDGDVIELSAKAQKIPAVIEGIASPHRDVPAYLQVDNSKFTITFAYAPKFADVPYPIKMEPNLVVEFYSK